MLIETKLHPPAARKEWVERPELIKYLDDAAVRTPSGDAGAAAGLPGIEPHVEHVPRNAIKRSRGGGASQRLTARVAITTRSLAPGRSGPFAGPGLFLAAGAALYRGVGGRGGCWCLRPPTTHWRCSQL